MIVLLLAGQLLRGDFSKETLEYEAIIADLDGLAVEKDGRALINVNRADAEMLTSVDGIGETLAGRIIEYREEYGARIASRYYTALGVTVDVYRIVHASVGYM